MNGSAVNAFTKAIWTTRLSGPYIVGPTGLVQTQI